MSLGFPSFEEIPNSAGFASVEAFLRLQREAVAGARYTVEIEADAAWSSLPQDGRDRFVAALTGLDREPAALWRHAWWVHAIGGRPRAPFEIATNAELAQQLIAALRAALAPREPPTDLPRRLDAWWTELTRAARARIGAYTADRVAGAARRLRAVGVMPAGAPLIDEDDRPTPRRKRQRRPPSRAEVERVRAAGTKAVAAQAKLDRRFIQLGPVCGACTRETGGCCSLTVPLLWREADYRLMALGDVEVPTPSPETAGACPFLGLEGCRLSAGHRPHICRSFLCERAEAALGGELPAARAEIDELGVARSQLVL